MDSALFHLEHAASSDSVEANRELAKIYLQLPHDILENFIAEVSAPVFGQISRVLKKPSSPKIKKHNIIALGKYQIIFLVTFQ